MTKIQPGNPVDHFSVAEAASLSNLTIDMMNYLCRYEIIIPSGSSKRGRGRARKYLFSDILILRVISRLLSKGVSVLKLRRSISSLQNRNGQARDILTRKYLATDGEEIYLQDDGVLELLSTGQLSFAFVLELGAIRDELTTDIGNIQRVASN